MNGVENRTLHICVGVITVFLVSPESNVASCVCVVQRQQGSAALRHAFRLHQSLPTAAWRPQPEVHECLLDSERPR